MFHPELPGGRYGVAGKPVPYNIHNDDIITFLLLVLFVMAVIAFSNTRQFVIRQTKNFFNTHREGLTEITETVVEIRFQTFLGFLNCLLIALLFYFYTLNTISDTFILASQYTLIAILLAISSAYFLSKILLYSLVNSVFFDGKKNRQWLKSFLYIYSMEGALFFPVVILWAYFFFRQSVVKLQIILYFCTLEIIPLLLFWVAMVYTANSLKINF